MPGEAENVQIPQSVLELEARDKRRLEIFVDGVFAIAITLLGIGFTIPIVQHSNEALLTSLVALGPKFVGYFLAFALLGLLLNNNWRQFQNISYADWQLYFINILFLAFVVLVPFATTVWTEYPDVTIGVQFFHVVMFVAGVCLYLNWFYVRRRPYLLKKGITERTLREIRYRNASFPLASALAIVIALASAELSNVAYVLIIVIFWVMRLRHGHPSRLRPNDI